MAGHSYGYIQDVKDANDFRYAAARPMTAPLPAMVDLRHLCSPVRDQGQLGSCTGFAIAVGMREFLLNKLGAPFVQLSPLFLYYEERVREHTVNQDAGAQPRDGFKVLAKLGCAPESDDVYNINLFTQPPSKQAVHDAANYKIAAYHRLHNQAEMQACLAGGNGFVIGFQVFESFESDAVAATGKMPIPAASEKSLGGHAVFCAGYQTDASVAGGGAFIIKNSWSTSWGDKGYFYMPFAYIRPDWVMDAWTAVV
jgi:C1A family cysteine protease